MEGITDAPMRAVQTESGAFRFVVSEFLRVCNQAPPRKVFERHIPELGRGCVTPSGTPVQIQLLGGNAEALAQSAADAVSYGAQAIDLNFGCPAPTVNRHDGGATLLKYPHRIREIVSAVRRAVPQDIPVSAKLRLGWDSLDPILENAEQAALGGADWITIHGRTRQACYNPPIYWEPIGEVRKRLAPLPVVANGDIWTLEDFRRCREITGCEHYMLGRGALVDPYLAPRVAQELGIATAPVNAPFGKDPKQWAAIFSRFEFHTEQRPDRAVHVARRIKQWTRFASIYGPLDWMDRIKRLDTYETIHSELVA
ncbi:tRNA-dihydrouridine synthase family protein [bacterium]|nr:tRNA-dihydrouridine synthase family protein [bacterium]